MLFMKLKKIIISLAEVNSFECATSVKTAKKSLMQMIEYLTGASLTSNMGT